MQLPLEEKGKEETKVSSPMATKQPAVDLTVSDRLARWEEKEEMRPPSLLLVGRILMEFHNDRQTDRQTVVHAIKALPCLMVFILYMVWDQIFPRSTVTTVTFSASLDTAIHLFLALQHQTLQVILDRADAVDQLTSFIKVCYGQSQRFVLMHNGRYLKVLGDTDLVDGDTIRVTFPLLGGAEEPQDILTTPRQGSGGGAGGEKRHCACNELHGRISGVKPGKVIIHRGRPVLTWASPPHPPPPLGTQISRPSISNCCQR